MASERGAFEPTAEPGRKRVQLLAHLAERHAVALERRLAADRFAHARRADRTQIDSLCELVIQAPRLAETLDEKVERLRPQIGPAADASSCIRRAVTRPTPQNASIGKRAIKAAARSGWIVHSRRACR